MPKSPLVHLEDQEFPLAISQQGKDRYAVTYGQQEVRNLNWLAAAHEFGECLFHALECAGKIQRPTDHQFRPIS